MTKTHPYACSYTLDGERWHFEIMATSREDAARRVAAIGMRGKVDGEIAVKVGTPNLRQWLKEALALKEALVIGGIGFLVGAAIVLGFGP